MSRLLDTTVAATAVGSGLVAGVLFGFSTFVMPALSRLPAPQGVAAMQEVNRQAERSPLFLAVLMGTGVACVALAVTAALRRDDRAWWLAAGAALYLVGCLGVTVARNIPLNEALASVTPDMAAAEWDRYTSRWTAWNHVRTVAGAAAAAAFTVAIRVGD